MPNWCENRMLVSSKNSEKIQEIYNLLKNRSEDGFFTKLIPTPQELLDAGSPITDAKEAEIMLTKYGAPDWYWWRVNNWGTKWDIAEIHFPDGDNHINNDGEIFYFVCNFDTAWAPPEAGIEKVSSIYKNVYFHLEYREEGMGFTGYATFWNGSTKSSACVETYPTIDNVELDLEYHMSFVTGDDDDSE